MAGLRNDTFGTLPDSNTADFRATSRTLWDYEAALREGRYSSPFVYSGGIHAATGSLVSNAFATEAFVPERANQIAAAITYTALTNAVCWVIISSDDDGIAGWVRVGTTAYYYQAQTGAVPIAPIEPDIPANSILLMQVTITDSAIVTVTDRRAMRPVASGITSYGSLSQAITAIGGLSNDLVINRSQVVGVNTTIPSNITLIFSDLGMLDIQPGITLTLNAPFAPPRQIFTGTGTVAFVRDSVIKSEWFSGLQRAVDSLATNAGGTITIERNFTQATQIVLPAVSLAFVGLGNRLISSTLATIPLFSFNGAGDGQIYKFRDIALIGPGGSSGDGLYVRDTANSGLKVVLEDFSVSLFSGEGRVGIYLSRVYFAHLSHLDIRQNDAGIWIDNGSNDHQWHNVQLFTNVQYGARFGGTGGRIDTFGWFGGRIENNGHGIWAQGLSDALFTTLHFEGNNRANDGRRSLFWDGSRNVAEGSNTGITMLNCRNAETTAIAKHEGTQAANTFVTYDNSSFPVEIGSFNFDQVKKFGRESTGITSAVLSLNVGDQPAGMMQLDKRANAGGVGVDYFFAILEQPGVNLFYEELSAATNSIRNTVSAPSSHFGLQITFIIEQDAIGGRPLTFDTQYMHAWSDTGNTANRRSTITFVSNGDRWIQVGAQSPYML